MDLTPQLKSMMDLTPQLKETQMPQEDRAGETAPPLDPEDPGVPWPGEEARTQDRAGRTAPPFPTSLTQYPLRRTSLWTGMVGTQVVVRRLDEVVDEAL